MRLHDAADLLALEHIRWAKADGQKPGILLQALGKFQTEPGWDDVLDALAQWLIVSWGGGNEDRSNGRGNGRV